MSLDCQKRAVLGAAVLSLLVALAACGSAPEVPGEQQSGVPTTAELRSNVPGIGPTDPGPAGSAITTFGTSLFAKLPAEGNLAFSPYSAYAALAMTRAGARGVTATELDTVLRTSRTAEAGGFVTTVDHAWAVAVKSAAPTEYDKRSMTFDPANSLWAKADLKIERDFLEQLASNFGAGLWPVDFAGNPERSRKEINDWVSDRTHELIPELLPPSAVSAATKLALINAVYFAGAWRHPFLKSAEKEVFHASDGDVTATVMRAANSYRHASGNGWQAVTIPYHLDGAAMTLIVPDSGRFDEVAGAFGEEVLTAATSGSMAHLQLTMPLFSVRTSSDLVPPLMSLGVRSLFENADLSGIAGPNSGLTVSDVVQEAVVTVDENGTVAAAATAVLTVTSAPVSPVELTIDRPFFFLIHDLVTDTPLFLGRVLNPTK